VYPTIASQFNDPGVNWVFARAVHAHRTEARRSTPTEWTPAIDITLREPKRRGADSGCSACATSRRSPSRAAHVNARIGVRRPSSPTARSTCTRRCANWPMPLLPEAAGAYAPAGAHRCVTPTTACVCCASAYQATLDELDADSLELLREWPERLEGDHAREYTYTVRGKAISAATTTRESAEPAADPEDRAPRYASWGELLPSCGKENLPGLLPLHRRRVSVPPRGRGPDRMFAGEGTPGAHQPPLPLPGARPARQRACRPPSTRSRCTARIRHRARHLRQDRQLRRVDRDARRHEEALLGLRPVRSDDLGVDDHQRPAPMILAMFMNTAIDQQVEKHLKADGPLGGRAGAIDALFAGNARPRYAATCRRPTTARARLLGITGDQVVRRRDLRAIKRDAVARCAAPCRPTS
jgi:methylmalonyl-CoA mutase